VPLVDFSSYSKDNMEIIYIALAGLNGGVVTLSRLINSALGSYVGSLPGSLINHAVGTLFAALLLIIGTGSGELQLFGIPPFLFVGGVLGVFLVTCNNVAVPRIGSTAVAILMLFAQLCSSSLIDHFGLLGANVLSLTPLKLAGLSLLFLGSICVAVGKTE
jgi:bacterial/archaeal transporter family-2 protein